MRRSFEYEDFWKHHFKEHGSAALFWVNIFRKDSAALFWVKQLWIYE